MKKPKVALVHDYLVQYGGAEKTLEALCELYPNAPVYTGIYKPNLLSDYLNSRDIRTSAGKVNKIMSKLPKLFTFLMPLVFEHFNLTEYDLVISDGSAWAKGVLTKPDQLHVSYVHTPPRFLYGYTVESAKRNKWYLKPFVKYIDYFLRIWDYSAAQRPDFLTCNSKTVNQRIKKFYKREAEVIYPPVDMDIGRYEYAESDNLAQPYYVALGRLSAYKNFDLVINAFNVLETKLIVMGTGIEEKRLKKIAHENIEFMGQVTEEQKQQVLHNALGFIFPVEDEDFGISPIEAMLHGLPVLAHRSGGPLEIIREDVDGMFFDEVNVEHFVAKMKVFDKKIRSSGFDRKMIEERARSFNDKEKFKGLFGEFVVECWKQKKGL